MCFFFSFVRFKLTFLIKVFILGITMQLDVSVSIYHRMKKRKMKENTKQKYGGLDQNPYINKNDR